MSCFLVVIEVLQGLLTPIIGVGILYIAIQQWRINQNRLRHELFDRRFVMFEAARDLILAILREAEIGPQDLRTFIGQTVGSRFLFSRKVNKYVETLVAKARELQKIQRSLDALATKITAMEPSAAEINEGLVQKCKELENQSTDIVLWFADQMDEIERIFEADLKLT